MSIKGFEVGGVQERYDYTALDNTPANLVQDANYVHTDNNFTNADKTKLDGIATGANKTIIDATLTQSGQAADAKATGDELDDLKSALDTKANINGSYIDMTVGNAEQLVATVSVNDKVPYTFRTSGGSADIGDRETDMVVGGTVAWNQQFKEVTSANWIYTDASLGEATFSNGECAYTTLSDSTSYRNGIRSKQGTLGVVGHKYLIYTEAKASRDGIKIGGDICNVGFTFTGSLTSSYQAFAKIVSCTARQEVFFCMRGGHQANDVVTFKNLMLFDLTQMFGSTVADYIYSLEQANAGAGVAFFRKLFPKPYYEYNAGELLSVNASAHKMVGFNAYDHTAGTAKVVGGNQYQITGAYTALSLGGEAITPDSNGFFTPSESGTLTVTGGNDSTTCVHLVWSDSRNGEYEPYVEHTYPLDSSLTLRGIPKLSADNTLYYDGDTYESDGKVTRKYGVIVYNGSETWTAFGEQGYYIALNGMKKSTSYVGVLRCDKLPTFQSNYRANFKSAAYGITGWENWSSPGQNYIYIKTGDVNATDAASVKAWLQANPITVVYELATPTEETADPYQKPQIVNDFGTEEYIVTEQNGVAVPVGHVTTYPANLRDKLQHLPDLADADGYYMIQQTNNDMSLIRFRIPQAPTTDGEYVLKATVSGGTPTYTWEANA